MSPTSRISREQLSMFSLDCLIAANNPVRVIDLFVDQLPLGELGFKKTKAKLEGRPPFEARIYLSFIIMVISTAFDLHANLRQNVSVMLKFGG